MKNILILTLFTIVFSAAAFAVPPKNDDFANAQNITNEENAVAAYATGSNANATVEPGEPVHLNASGGHSVWYRWETESLRPIHISLNRSNFNTLIGVYKGSSLGDLTLVAGNDDISASNTKSAVIFQPTEQTTYYIVVDCGDSTTATGNIVFDLSPVIAQGSDFDGDGATDPTVYRVGDSFYSLSSATGGLTGFRWGQKGDIPVTGNLTQSFEPTKSDYIVFRPSDGYWHIVNTDGSGYRSIKFGMAGDVPLVGNFIGDANPDVAVYRPSEGNWYYSSLNGTPQVGGKHFGQPGDIPVAGNYDDDEIMDVAVYRPSNGTWYIDSSQNGFLWSRWGLPTDIPVRGDYDGNGRDDLAVYRPSEGMWYTWNTMGLTAVRWGAPGDQPQVGDYNGDGLCDFAVFRGSNDYWYIQYGGNALPPSMFKWGNHDYPVSSLPVAP